MIFIVKFGLDNLNKASAKACIDPSTSPLIIMFILLYSPFLARSSRSLRVILFCVCIVCSRNILIFSSASILAFFSSSITKNFSPDLAALFSPTTLTGSEG